MTTRSALARFLAVNSIFSLLNTTKALTSPIVGPILNMQKDCYGPLLASDADNSKTISPAEYIKFVQSFSDDAIFDVNVFRDLPIEVIEAHNIIVTRTWCEIMEPNNINSCLASQREIIISGIPPQNDNDLEFLYNTCANTQIAVFEAQGYVPSDHPTSSPSHSSPTVSPPTSSSPVAAPVVSTPSPTPLDPDMRRILVPFGIASKSGLTAPDYDAEALLPLDISLNDLVKAVIERSYVQQIGGRSLRGLIQSRRRLGVIADDNGILSIESKECPTFILAQYNGAKCSIMTGFMDVAIFGDDSNNIVSVSNNIYDTAQKMIPSPFQNFIDNANGTDYIAYNVTSGSTTKSFPLSAILGIAAGAVLVGICAGRRYAVTRQKRLKPDPDSDSISAEFDSPFEDTENTKLNPDLVAASGVSGENVSVDSSNAGSSGWSSSAGLSSLNTGLSVDSDIPDHQMFNSSLAAISAASNILHKPTEANASTIFPIRTEDDLSESSARTPPGNKRSASPATSRMQLESAIDAGDWAAVGATAAILANDARSINSGDSSVSSTVSKLSSGASTSGISNHLSVVSSSSRDKFRAAELDRLVDAGDWEGVVLTAARFEAEKDDKTDGSASNSSRKADRSLGNLSNNSPSVSTNISDSLSANLKRAELRAEVESLVRRVVPDEIDNVDEMMTQFRGREEELVETLRTMQERSIAARQREASRRNAKREAKKIAKASKKSSKVLKSDTETEPLVHPEKKSGSASDTNSWSAVGKTAEQIIQTTEYDSSSGQSSDFDSAAEDESDAYLSADSGQVKASNIEGLINKNDWSGVVAAASAYSKSGKVQGNDDQEKTHVRKESVSSDSSKGTAEREEAEARAQAHMWANIAQQSKKVEGSVAIGASDAADWAISRSLKQIQDSSVKVQPDTRSEGSSNGDDNHSV